MRSYRFFYFLLFFLLSSGVSLVAQTFDFISYGVEEGLSQSEAQCVFQDSRGYLWVGTAGGGVCSFDGQHFHEYGIRDGLAGQIVNTVEEDSSGNLWFGTQMGVTLYDGKTFSTLGQDGLKKSKITSIIARKNGVWIAGPGGILEYTLSNQQVHYIASTHTDVAMCSDENNIVWAGAGSSLYRFDQYKKDSIDLHLPAGSTLQIYSLCSDRHGLIYIGTSEGLKIYRPSTGTFSENGLTTLLQGKIVHDIYTDHSGNTWVATLNNLVVKYHPQEGITRYDRTNGLTAQSVLKIAEDNTHHIWLATREQSLVKLRSETFTYFGNVPGFNSGTVFRLLEDHNGKMWAGSDQDGLYCFDPKLPENDPHRSVPVMNSNGKCFAQPVAAIEDRKEQVWIGHTEGLTCLVNERPVKSLLPGVRVRALFVDSKGDIWAGTWGKGVYVIHDGQVSKTLTATNDQLPSDYVHAFCEDHLGNIWIGTGNGLAKYDGKMIKSYRLEDGLCNMYIGSLVEDKAGNIWFHTDECVMRFDGKRFTSYNDANGLASTTYYLLAFDHEGNLWVGTNKGIDRVKVDAEGRMLEVKNFSRNEGFRGIECNSRAVCVTRDGCLWFGTVKGVIRYDPSKELPEQVQPSVHISGIRLFLEPTEWTSITDAGESGWYHLPVKLELDHEHNHLTFLYESVNLQSPQATRYQFMLVGFDSVWQPVTSAMQITYANLPPGHYMFRVIASNGNGKWTPESAASCPITILAPPPPFWQRGWFIAITLLLAAGATWFTWRTRVKRTRQMRDELEAEVRARTTEITRQNEEKALMLKEIHHRVKNNLQVISSLLNLQAEGITDRRVLTLFEDCRHRVNSMALIHEKMYQSRNLVNIDIRSYIDDLVRSLIDAYDTNKIIHLETDIEDRPFRIDTIVPLGLILNEIISNSLKYAFGDRSEGTLSVSLHMTGPNRYRLEVADNGKGIPGEVDLQNASSLGMQLIVMLTSQLNGKVELRHAKGTRYLIDFEEEAKDRF